MDNNEHIPTGQSLRYAWPAARDMHKKCDVIGRDWI